MHGHRRVIGQIQHELGKREKEKVRKTREN